MQYVEVYIIQLRQFAVLVIGNFSLNVDTSQVLEQPRMYIVFLCTRLYTNLFPPPTSQGQPSLDA